MLAAIKQFTSTLRSEDEFFFLAFSEHGSFVTGFVPSADQVLDHLRFVKPGGPSSLYDSVYLAAGRLKESRNLKKALLVISDGQDISSIQNYNKLRNRLRIRSYAALPRRLSNCRRRILVHPCMSSVIDE